MSRRWYPGFTRPWIPLRSQRSLPQFVPLSGTWVMTSAPEQTAMVNGPGAVACATTRRPRA
jgi:hypothetical protein